jgi:transcriptional regulator with XRE-family HTH domain
MENFSNRLAELQSKGDYLKKDICQAVGIGIMTYYRYEIGQRTPPLETLIALADFFNVSLDYLVGREFPKEDPTARTDKLEVNK